MPRDRDLVQECERVERLADSLNDELSHRLVAEYIADLHGVRLQRVFGALPVDIEI